MNDEKRFVVISSKRIAVSVCCGEFEKFVFDNNLDVVDNNVNLVCHIPNYCDWEIEWYEISYCPFCGSKIEKKNE